MCQVERMGLLQGGIQVSNEYAKFLRDFADANIDSFEDEQLRMLRNAAREIETLIEERNSARWEVCELSGNGSIDSASRVAEERGWDLTEEDEVVDANANNQDFRTTDMG
jgi:hypothetical protein